MIVIPAIDLREGACVQLVGGRYEDERVRLTDPVAVARRWAERGFRRLHLVDLDAATGHGSNALLIRRIMGGTDLEFQVGGGVRSRRAIEDLMAAGAARVIIGTRAIEDHEWLESVAAAFPGRLIVAADVLERGVLTQGWQKASGLDVFDTLARLGRLPIAGVLVTAVHREGRLGGTDLDLMEQINQRSCIPLFVAGGIATTEELQVLAELGCHAAIVGMALYTRALDLDQMKEYVT